MNNSVAIKTSKIGNTDLREVFVLAAMSLVAVAVGVGLYAQFEAGFLLALLATCVGYVVLLTMHVLVRRAQQVHDLEAELARLTSLIADMQRGDGARVKEGNLTELEPVTPPVRAPRPPSRRQTRPTSPAGEESGPSEVLPPPPPAISIGGHSRPNKLEPSFSAETHTVVLMEPTNSSATITSGPVSERTTVESDTVANVMSVSVSKTTEQVVPIDPSEAVTVPLNVGDAATRSACADTVSGTAAAGEAREFENMQVLIKQLAAQLNAPAGDAEDADGKTGAAAPSGDDDATSPLSSDADAARVAAVADQAIGQSAALLRAAAGDLRRMDAAPLASDASEPVRAAVVDTPDDVAPPLTSASHWSQSPYGRLAQIAEAVEADRIEVYLDPIMTLDERRARHFEVSVRLRTQDLDSLDTEDFNLIASQNGLLPRIESAKLARTAKVAERLAARGSTGALFASFDGGSLGDDGFRQTYIGLFEDGVSPDGRLVLAFAQSDVRAFTRAHWQEIATMSRLGLHFSLEAVTDLDMDFEQLVASGFGFIKLDAKVFLEGLPTADGGAVPASDLCRHLSGLGLALVVGRIEEERDLAQIVGFGATLGQGSLFGAPRPVKVDITPTQAAA